MVVKKSKNILQILFILSYSLNSSQSVTFQSHQCESSALARKSKHEEANEFFSFDVSAVETGNHTTAMTCSSSSNVNEPDKV